MVDIRELRVGNWLMGKLGPQQVEPLDFKYMVVLNSADPIPLTPEILEKCGFVKMMGILGLYPIDISARMEVVIFGGNYEGGHDIHHIIHLHQLQNLYYALTGTELNYVL